VLVKKVASPKTFCDILKPCSHCVRRHYGDVCRRMSTYVRRRTSPYVHVCQCTATYGTVRQVRTPQMLNYMLLTVLVVNGHNCVAVGRQRNATCRTYLRWVNNRVDYKKLAFNSWAPNQINHMELSKTTRAPTSIIQAHYLSYLLLITHYFL